MSGHVEHLEVGIAAAVRQIDELRAENQRLRALLASYEAGQPPAPLRTQEERMSKAPWGLNSDGLPKTAREAAHERIEAVIRKYITIGLATASAGGLDDKTIHTILNLHLAEPWLPASEALEALEFAGLLRYDLGGAGVEGTP
ncbi:cell division protein ZapB [Rhodococcus sp. Z13]|uniref:Cell division protein ZapB n=1 Tax=Rhodococcus sacchari TaxID=2962047 RepID=A0ACD4DCM9_9NOCA|nr:cell division protein ZapB [Rhodococcus sp. Z13]UYP17734.1 cell division protein ZapB [Rhodococcus sp. Z13]